MKMIPIDSILLLGGGRLLRKLCLWAKSEGVPIKVVTSKRHALELSDSVSLEEFLISHDIDHLVAEAMGDKETLRFIRSATNPFCLSLGAAWIFKPGLIKDVFRSRLFNSHGTRLPQNRGGGGFSWQILMGNRLGFCTLHLIDDGVDTGDIIKTKEFLYPARCRTPLDYEEYHNQQNFDFLIEFIEILRHGELTLRPHEQSEYFSSYWPRLNTNLNAWIDWSSAPEQIERFICAFDKPYSGAQTTNEGKIVHLRSVCLNYADGQFHPFQSGLIYRKSESWICIALKGCGLIVEEILNEHGDSVMSDLQIGDRLVTPFEKLESSMQRVFYTPKGLRS